MTTQIYPNSVFATTEGSFPEKMLESNVLILAEIFYKQLPDIFFVFGFSFAATPRLLREDCLLNIETNNYDKSVLIWIGEEYGLIPSEKILNKYTYVFKEYLKEEFPELNLYSMPLITPGSMICDSIIPMSKRKIDIFFSGNLNLARLDLYRAINTKMSFIEKISAYICKFRLGNRLFPKFFGDKTADLSYEYKNSIIKFNNGFNKGYNKEEYARITSESKIILSPRGFHSAECFRLYEAMSLGCVVITESLPDVSFYKDIPVVQVKDWEKLRSHLTVLLDISNPELQQLSNEALTYYQRNLSLSAINDYIKRTIHNEL